MCGIFGFFNQTGKSISDDRLAEMASQLKYRGPDSCGIYSKPGVALGNQRLSIIDLEGGNQPFFSDDEAIVVVQNGEIFNYRELAAELKSEGFVFRSDSDTEVILRLYERHGIAFLNKLNGMFAIAIYDARTNDLYVVRDRIGVKPLYYSFEEGHFTFASEIKSIFKSGVHSPVVNFEGLSHYLSFNYIPAPYTAYRGVEHIKPGTYLKVNNSKIVEKTWWTLSDVQPISGRNEQEWIDEFLFLLEDSVRLRLRCDVPFGAFLSGGIDSSSVVGCMSKILGSQFKTFCIGFEDPKYDESAFAKLAATRFNTEHLTEMVAPDLLDLWPQATFHCDQPHGDVSFLPTLVLSKLASKHVKVVLTGDGADELFGGYDKYVSFFGRDEVASKSADDFQRAYFKSISLFSEEDKARLFQESCIRNAPYLDSYFIAKKIFNEVPHQDRINQVLYLDMQLLLSGNNLVKPDRMGMAHSLEARTPFLDYRLMEFAFRMPGELKIQKGTTKYLYKKAVSSLIGENLAYRPKQMFTVPIGEWFKTSRRSYCKEHLDLPIFKSEYTNSLFVKHINHHQNLTRELRAIIAVKHWLNIFNPSM